MKEFSYFVILPFLSIFIMGRVFPPNSDYRPIFQPPNYVFGIAWTYISIVFGLSYLYIKNSGKLLYFTILLLLTTWLPVFYYKYYQASFYLNIITTLLTAIYIHNIENWVVRLLVLPMLIWLILATSLNGVIYDRKTNSINILK